MLHEFTVDNFKSLINVTFCPREQNLLLGVNNAGKTNLCQAVAFLSATARWPLSECVNLVAGGPVGITNHYFQKETIDFRARATVPFENEELSFEYSLTISVRTELPENTTLEVQEERLYVTGSRFDGIVLLDNTSRGVRLLHESDYVKGRQNFVETSAPREGTMLQRLYDLETNPRANCFKKYLHSWQYYALSPEAMRGYRHYPNQMFLHPDGSNVASVMFYLKTSDDRRYRKVVKRLRKIDPGIDAINFIAPSQDSVFMFFEDEKANKLLAANASSGTLRYLGLLYLLSAQPALTPSPLIVIEEPENGLYVGVLRELLASVEEVQPRPQLIFTSHSPYFIDLFEDRLEGVFLLKPGEQHSSITQPDVQKVKRRLEDYPLGEQHFREMLG